MQRILVAGGSMSPTLEVGDVALVRPGDRARCGDVLLFEAGPEQIIHRAILVLPRPGGALIVHRGDARGAGYGTLGERAVIGRVVAFERSGRRHELPRRGLGALDLLGAFAKLARVMRARVARTT